jgi:DNA-binding beta-propeller fold protein YncE
LALALLGGLAVAQPARAAAITDAEELTRFGSVGSAAGQLRGPLGVATDPTTGHVLVVDGDNNRISEFTPWGGFVKAFGWDVAPGGVNEEQEIRVRAAAGQFRLSFGVESSVDLAFDASAADVEAALESLASIGADGVGVKAVAGTFDGTTPIVYVVTFKGALAGTNVAQLVATNGTTALTGGIPTTGLEVRTRADGTAGSTGLESCTAESECRAGLEGAGAGEFRLAGGSVVADANGGIYVTEVRRNHRVQKFDSAGRFLLMFGGEVNKTTGEDRCTASGDECGIGIEGSGPGEFGPSCSSGIALGSGTKLFVADTGRIQRFNSGGEYEASVAISGKTVHDLGIDPVSGDFYAIVGSECGTDQNVHKLSATTGAEIGELKGEGGGSGSLAVDLAGDVFARDGIRVLEFDSAGKQISSFGEAELLPPPNLGQGRFAISGLGINVPGTAYVAYNSFQGFGSFVRAFGPGPTVFEAPPKVAPEIGAQFSSGVRRDGATVVALINPRFWANTRYFVQYGTGKCSEGGCTEEVPVPPGTLLTSKVSGLPLRSSGVPLENLKSGTIYHYRFVAESGGGGPVFGVDPDGEGSEEATSEAGLEATFTTFELLPLRSCPNEAFRGGPAGRLSDCRAYEMVSPVDKNNGDIKALNDGIGYTTNLVQSASDGGKVTYSSYRSFGDPEGAPYTAQYIATRDAGNGWSSEAINATQGPNAAVNPDGVIPSENLYKAFSTDLCDSWFVLAAEPPLVTEASKGYPGLFRRDNCDGEGYEEIPAKPSGGVEPGGFNPEIQGASTDGKEAIFRIQDKLTPEAASGVWQTYYSSKGQLHLLCILPNGSPSGDNCSGGTGGVPTPLKVDFTDLHRLANVSHAVSADGSRVYWTTSGSAASGPGKLYLRINPDQEQSALDSEVCIEAAKACTVKVSDTVSTKAARFLAASPDGSKALFEITEGALAGNLYEFNLEAGGSNLIAKKVGLEAGSAEPFAGLVGAGDDLSYIYFVSSEASAEAITEGAVKNRPNLYLFHEGVASFIATLSNADVASREIPSNTSPEPIYHAARVTPDGRHVAFISTESLTGYDNTDLVTGEADSEVYAYEAGADAPLCVSCNPGGARPQGRVVKVVESNTSSLAVAASIPPAQFLLNPPRPLSSDGGRLFFNSYDALLPRDTNGKEDVYEWEKAASKEACVQLGAEIYVEAAGGCLSLISSGESPQDSEFLDADARGDNVFFSTGASLLPQDPGLIDIYDARAGGGFPAPQLPVECHGEACQSPARSPNDPTPSSSAYEGPGNEKKAKKKAHHKRSHRKKNKKGNSQKQRGQR